MFFSSAVHYYELPRTFASATFGTVAGREVWPDNGRNEYARAVRPVYWKLRCAIHRGEC